MGPDQTPRYQNFSRRRTNEPNGWEPQSRVSTMFETFDYRSSGNGPRDGGSFGAIMPGQGYAHANMYLGEATTAPTHRPHSWGPHFAPGLFGEMIPGIDGGNGYGYRETHPRFAMADWGDAGEPQIPGRGGLVGDPYGEGIYGPAKTGSGGYKKRAEDPNILEPREFGARVEASMKRQLALGGEDRAQQWAAGLMTPEQLQQRYRHLWR